MVKVTVSQSLVEIEVLKARLEEAGIPCFIKNQHASTLAGEVPFAEVFPELWVNRDEDLPAAKELVSIWKEDDRTHGLNWTCGNCGERHGGQYTDCWKCGAVRNRPETDRDSPQ